MAQTLFNVVVIHNKFPRASLKVNCNQHLYKNTFLISSSTVKKNLCPLKLKHNVINNRVNN